MLRPLRPAALLLLAMTLITGLVYPLAVTGLARLFDPSHASGSLIVRDGHVVGSRLIGQPFDAPRYFWGRLSATQPVPFNAAASAGSDFGPTNPALLEAARARIAALLAAEPENDAPVPIDLVTSSASGLDPHISPAAAAWQARRVARARGLESGVLLTLVEDHTEGRLFGVLGEPTVNVLELNLALDDLDPARR